MKKALGIGVVLVGVGAGLWLWRTPPPAAAPSSARPGERAHEPARASPGPTASAEPAAGARPAAQVLRVQVRSDGRPAPGATVWLDGVAQSAPTDAAGRWSKALEAAPSWVGATQGAYAASPAYLDGFPKEEVVLSVAPAGSVDGRVISRATGAPISGVRVRIGAQQAVTNDDGAFALAAVPLGRLEVRLTHPGFVSTRATFSASTGSTTHLALALDRAALLTGVVVDRGDAPVAQATVTVSRLDRSLAERAVQTDDSGRFTFDAVPPGALTLSARAPGFAPAERAVSAPASAQKLVLKRGGELGGTVFDAQGRGRAHARVFLFPAPGNRAAQLSVHADDAGRYDLVGIAPGKWWVGATAQGAIETEHQPIVVVDEAYRQLDFHLSADGKTVRGTVVDAETQQPLVGATISWHMAKGKWGTAPSDTFSDAQGRFEVDNVPDRVDALTAVADGYQLQQLPVADTLAFALRRGVTASGRVVDSRGAPLHDFWVGDITHAQPADGRFEVQLETDANTLEIDAPGFLAKKLELPPPNAAHRIELGDVALTQAPEVTVTVFDPSGAPDPGAGIYRWNTNKVPFRRQIDHGAMSRLALTDENGVAHLHFLPAKTCFVAYDPRYPPSGTTGCPHTVTDQGGAFEVHLPQPGWIHGHVYGQGGVGVAGQRIVDATEEREALTDASGAYRLGPLGAGPHKVKITRGDPPAEETETATVVAGQDQVLDFGGADTGSLDVTVRIGRGTAGIMVFAYSGPEVKFDQSLPPDARRQPAAVTDGRAVVRFADLKAGHVTVIGGTEHNHRAVGAEVVAGQTTPLQIDLTAK